MPLWKSNFMYYNDIYLDFAGGERLHTSSIVKTLKSRTDLVELVLVSKLATYITSLQLNFVVCLCLFCYCC